MSDEQKDDSAFHLARCQKDLKAALHTNAMQGEQIRILARERDAARLGEDHLLRENYALQKSLQEEQRQHEETKQKLILMTTDRDMFMQVAERELKRLKRSRRK